MVKQFSTQPKDIQFDVMLGYNYLLFSLLI